MYSEEVTIVVRIGDGSRIITVFRFFLANKGLGGSSDIFGGSGMSDSMSDSEWLSGDTWFFWFFFIDILELRDEIVSKEIPVFRVFLESFGSTPIVSSTLFRYRSYRSFVQHNGASNTRRYTFYGSWWTFHLTEIHFRTQLVGFWTKNGHFRGCSSIASKMDHSCDDD